MIRSLVARLTLLAQLTALIVITTFGISSLWVTAHVLKTERHAFVAETARRLARSFKDELAEEPDTILAARRVIEDAMEVGVRVELRDAAGRLLASSHAARGTGRLAFETRGSAGELTRISPSANTATTVVVGNDRHRPGETPRCSRPPHWW